MSADARVDVTLCECPHCEEKIVVVSSVPKNQYRIAAIGLIQYEEGILKELADSIKESGKLIRYDGKIVDENR